MTAKQRSTKNKTLTLSEEEKLQLSGKLLQPESDLTVEELTNKTIYSDMFAAIKLLPEAFADLIIIDPPYNLTKDFAGMKFKRMSDDEYLDYLESWFPDVLKCLKLNGSLYLCGDWKCTSALYQIMSKYMTVVNRITWQREKGKGAKANWKNAMEDIWFGVNKPNDYYFDIDAVKIRRKVIAPYKQDGKPKDWEETSEGNFRMTHPSNFWDDITVPYWSMPENTDHPTQKPEKLIAKLILASCPEGGLVFDPFVGSGTTSVVAKKLNRNYCGIEHNLEYAYYTEKRLLMAKKDKTIQGYADGVFWERNTALTQKQRQKKKQITNT
ncbi:site-specific DNA-methyltransferase (adenine-specific) [Dysgonomonadaceae bacterium PH5-43]|nr:site-specific DNA-methyltransferase (adenine-specific) [Dysgonomonadaceae bacterium PH5-43]